MATSVNLIKREYKEFRGVDFSNRKDEVSIYRSPDALNMWKNYKNSSGKCIETRPDIELLEKHSDTIFGLFFYTINGIKHEILHCGTNLYDDEEIIFEGMARNKSQYFIMNSKLYIKDGNKFLVYDGDQIKEIEGYIPTTSISRSPAGAGTIYEDVNLLTPYRKNTFVGDGTALEYILDVPTFDGDVRVWVNDIELTTGFKAVPNEGKVVFDTAPSEPLTIGQDNVKIQFKREVKGYRERIEKCTLVELFDNRVFFSGNPDYPNILFHSSLNDPSYCSDLDYYTEGNEDSKVKSIITGNNALWVLKEASQHNTTIFYHNPTIDSDYGKLYPSVHSSISIGCETKGINFNDTICFFSDRGMEAITGDITTEQVVSHKSTLVDARLLNEEKYKDMDLIEWEGYLLVIIGKKVYLADSRLFATINQRYEYEWYYWEFDKEITYSLVKDGKLYLCCDNEVYTLTKKDTNIISYWTTTSDEFGYPHYQKTSNKKGCVVDIEGTKVSVYVKTDKTNFEFINEYAIKKNYIVARIKKKKWKEIQLKFQSYQHFGLFSCTLESYIGSYVKR